MEERTMRFHAVEVIVDTPAVPVAPGGSATIPFRMVNRSGRDDYFEVTVRGIPSTWMSMEFPVQYLGMGETRDASLVIRPPIGMMGSSGVTAVTIQVISQADPNLTGEATFDLVVADRTGGTQTIPAQAVSAETVPAQVGPTQRFQSDLSPRQVVAGQTARVRIQNLGTQPATFTLKWQAPRDELDVAASKTDPILVLPGETTAIDFALSPRNPQWFGGPVTIPYTVHVQAADGGTQGHSGEILSRSLIPVWVLPSLLVLCLTALCGAGFLWNWNQSRLVQATATAGAVLGLAEQTTATAVYNQTAAALMGQEDSDGDGLTNNQEAELGTNPQSADSDNDRLSDGDEIRLGTNPLNPDSDQDGVIDGLDIDPLDAANPSITQTAAAQIVPPTETVPPTQTSLPPTNTPPAPTATATTAPTATQAVLPVTGPGLVLFASDRDGNFELYVLNLADGRATRLTDNPGNDIEPVLSPDGTRIAFTSDRDGNNEIFVVSSDGSGFANLSNNPAEDTQPAWSPDGQFLAFTSNRDENNEIYIVQADGSNPTNLTDHPASDTQPDWYAVSGGTRLLFTTDRDGNSEIYQMEPNGADPENLTENGANERGARMRADGRRIVFVSDRDGNSEIYRMEDDGDNPENLSNSPSGDVTPYWSPDGEWIVFVSDREGDLDLYVMRSNGADPAPLVSEPSADRSPSWR